MISNNATSIKELHEESSVQRFLLNLNKMQKTTVSFLRLGDPVRNEPDVICSDGLAIELVGIYDNVYQAEKIWAEARNKNVFGQKEYKLLSLENLQDEIAKKLARLNGSAYDGFSGKIILLCNLHSPLIESYELEQFIKSYMSFRNDAYFERYFYEVWVSWKSENDGNWKITKLE